MFLDSNKDYKKKKHWIADMTFTFIQTHLEKSIQQSLPCRLAAKDLAWHLIGCKNQNVKLFCWQ